MLALALFLLAAPPPSPHAAPPRSTLAMSGPLPDVPEAPAAAPAPAPPPAPAPAPAKPLGLAPAAHAPVVVGSDVPGTGLAPLVASGALLAALGGVAWMRKKKPGAASRLRVVENVGAGKGRSMMLVDVNGRGLLVGVTDHGFSVLATDVPLDAHDDDGFDEALDEHAGRSLEDDDVTKIGLAPPRGQRAASNARTTTTQAARPAKAAKTLARNAASPELDPGAAFFGFQLSDEDEDLRKKLAAARRS
jgi:hypothetical protein